MSSPMVGFVDEGRLTGQRDVLVVTLSRDCYLPDDSRRSLLPARRNGDLVSRTTGPWSGNPVVHVSLRRGGPGGLLN